MPEQQLLGATVHAELLRLGLTLATAESITGGALADLVSASPGASETYLGGVVSYATSIKLALLEVQQATVSEQGVVSASCAAEMAAGVRRLLKADWGISTTGVAGPTEQEGKRVGTVFVGLAGPTGTESHQLSLDGDRAAIRATTCTEAATLLLERLVATVGAGNDR